MTSFIDKIKQRLNDAHHPHRATLLQLRPLLAKPAVDVVMINQPELRFNSKLLQLKLEYLLLDELLPRQENTRVKKGDFFQVSSLTELKMVSFTCKVQEVIKTATGCRYRLQLPSKIKNKNRRESFRMHLAGDVREVLDLNLPGNHLLIRPMLRDLSSEGFGMVLKSASHFKTGEIVEEAELILADESVIVFDFKVCSVIENHRSGNCIYGNQIINIDARAQRLLDNFIAQLQRSSRRKETELYGSAWLEDK